MEQQQRQQMSMQDRLLWLVLETDFEPIEALEALVKVGWACVILFDPLHFSTTPSFALLVAFVRPQVLGAFLGCLFLTHVLSAILRWTLTRAVVLFLVSWWWLLVAVCIVEAGGHITTGTVVYCALAICSAWSFFRFAARHNFLRRHRA